jgi:hypothetical protein
MVGIMCIGVAYIFSVLFYFKFINVVLDTYWKFFMISQFD